MRKAPLSAGAAGKRSVAQCGPDARRRTSDEGGERGYSERGAREPTQQPAPHSAAATAARSFLAIACVAVGVTPRVVRAESWPEFGRVPSNTFASSETWLSPSNAASLVKKWTALVTNSVN